ncbi:MAG: Hsp70 family protein [Candidatus Pacebacteria bacterium]|nr:Hsp70 family protein [Candidatus Paceibacterota bacterium]
MANQLNIQIGIDLGTTNSSVAVNNNGAIEIVKKPGGVEYTPSVFGFDKAGNKVVGQKAYEAYYRYSSKEEEKNYKPEVKRLMGTSETFHFERADIEMNPEAISAEILKNLKEDILRKYPDFNTVGAVITVPAAFSVLQSEATKRAGNLAGFKHVVLLQEPIAAAIAYGFGKTDNENWLIYDLGGGTFDVALIASKDGALSVLGHNGDNFLGGKNIDLEIVDKVIVPKILEKFSINNFNKANEKYRSIFSQLKFIAESAKIELSQYDKTSILVENVGVDDEGKDIFLTFSFSRKEFEKLIEPMIDRTIELSKETLKEAGIKSSAVAKVILVGGPTQIPYLRQRLEADLKITVDSSVDPLTVVAKGACVFGIGQKVPKELVEHEGPKVKSGALSLNLNHETLTSETEETVSGIIAELQESEDEYYVQIQSDSGSYNGQKIKLKNGKFFDTVSVEPSKTNQYWIYLFDKEGNSVSIDPDSFAITHGLSVAGAPLPHSVGIIVVKKDHIRNVAANVCERIFDKGSILPIKKVLTDYKTSRKLIKAGENKLDITLVEGESEIPDRNTYLSELEINGKDLPHDLPEGTPLELSVEMNESREVSVTAYIPLIDLTLKARFATHDEAVEVKNIEYELKVQTDRAQAVSETCTTEEKKKLNGTINAVAHSLRSAHADEDEKRKANKQLKDLKMAIDRMEKEKEMPQLVKEFSESLESAEKVIVELGDDKDKVKHEEQLAQLKAEGEKAVKENDKPLLIRVNEQVSELTSRAIYSNPSTWAYLYRKLTDGSKTFINEKEAGYYVEKGRRAIEMGDVDELKRCVHNLQLLLPSGEQDAMKSNLSGITR